MLLSASALALVPLIRAFVLANDVSKISCHQAFLLMEIKDVPFTLFEHVWQKFNAGAFDERPPGEVKLETTDNGSPSFPAAAD